MLLQDNTLGHVRETAELMDRYGIAFVFTAAYFVITIIIFVVIFRLARKIIVQKMDQNITNYTKISNDLTLLMDDIKLIANSIQDRTKAFVKSFISSVLNSCVYDLIFTINRFYWENNVMDKVALRHKVELYITMRRSRIEGLFRQVLYNNIPLDSYIDLSKYDQTLIEIIMDEVEKRSANLTSDERYVIDMKTENNIQIIFDTIKNDLYDAIHNYKRL